MSNIMHNVANFLMANIFAIVCIVVMSFALNEIKAPWWLNSLLVYTICESFHQFRMSSFMANEDYMPITPVPAPYPSFDPIVNDLAQYFLNKFKPAIEQLIKDCEPDIKEASGLGTFKFITVQIDDMVPNVNIKNVTIFDDMIVVSMKASLIVNCVIKFSVLKISGKFKHFAINGDLMIYCKTSNSLASPITAIEISFTKSPTILMTMSGFLSPFEGIIHDTIVKEVNGQMVAPQKYIIDMKANDKAYDQLKGRVRNLLINHYTKIYNNVQKNPTK